MPNIKLCGWTGDRMAINAAASLMVSQDEHLAPYQVLAVLMQSNGTKFGTGVVDFQVGRISAVTSDQIMPKFDEPILVQPEGPDKGRFIAHWHAKNRCYYLNI